ncbi:hypothetical protein [uncultured Nostoc sp.]|uniref:hypothetical protein n=1 Tax=uncultured Nostoc sp. TaxID=340711 RepID=UPI0035CC3954
MFQKIRYRLLLSYLVVFASLLGIFAIAVRVAFTRKIKKEKNHEEDVKQGSRGYNLLLDY